MQSNQAPAAPEAPDGGEVDRSLPRNAGLGLVLFFIYLAIYAGFVGVSTFSPGLMSKSIGFLGGINVAIAYGMLLIVAAFVLAMVYMALCKAETQGSGK